MNKLCRAIPFQISPDDEVYWLKAKSIKFDRPMFRDAIAAARKSDPIHSIIKTKLAGLAEAALGLKKIVPAGLIFHVGRCGSTLLSNAINAVDGTLVLAEPTFISSLFKNYISFGEQFHQQKNQQKIEYTIKSFVDILGNADDHNNGVYLKFTSWNTLFLQQLRKMWPNTPIVFAFRDPLDVLDSVLAKRIGWMRFYNDPVIVSALLKGHTGDIPFIDFSIKMLAQLYNCGLQLNPNDLLINYSNNRAENLEKMLAHFNLVPTPQDKVNIENTTLYYSKNKYRGAFFADINNGRKVILNQQTLKLVEDSGIIDIYKTLASLAQ